MLQFVLVVCFCLTEVITEKKMSIWISCFMRQLWLIRFNDPLRWHRPCGFLPRQVNWSVPTGLKTHPSAVRQVTPKVTKCTVHESMSSSSVPWSPAHSAAQRGSGVRLTSDLASPLCRHYIIRCFPPRWRICFFLQDHWELRVKCLYGVVQPLKPNWRGL